MARVSRGKSSNPATSEQGDSSFSKLRLALQQAAGLPDWIRFRSAQEIGKRLMKQLIFSTSGSDDEQALRRVRALPPVFRCSRAARSLSQ